MKWGVWGWLSTVNNAWEGKPVHYSTNQRECVVHFKTGTVDERRGEEMSGGGGKEGSERKQPGQKFGLIHNSQGSNILQCFSSRSNKIK